MTHRTPLARFSRRHLYRSAKTLLRKALSNRWKGSQERLDRAIRAALRGRTTQYLRKLIRAPACTAIVASCILAASAHGQHSIELADVAAGSGGFVINGETAGDDLGASVSGAGDVNGDGLEDLVVGADRAAAGNRDEAGRTYVVFGKSDTAPVDAATVAKNDAANPGDSGGFVINGISSFDLSGYSVSAAGDINGDGLGDLIIGAPTADPAGYSGAGQAFVVFGKADGAPINLKDVASGDSSKVGDSGGFVLNGIFTSDRAGHSVSGAGDVNGDGLDDIIVGAPWVALYDSTIESFAGQSYVVFGKADGAPVELADIALDDVSTPGDSGGFAINGMYGFDESGFSVSAAGDHNGDGLDDLLIGARYASTRDGHAYVVFGKTSGAPVELDAIVEDDQTVPGDSGGYLIDGRNVPGQFGFSVSGAGDVNGDGFPDVIVGSPPTLLFYPNYGTGEAYVVFGKPDGASVDAGVVAGNDATMPGDSGGFAINGAAVHDFAGASVSGAGDFNGDGLADVLVGSYRADPNGKNFAGQSYLVFGKSNGDPVELAALNQSRGLSINGAEPDDVSGFSVSGAGDVDGDGLADVIIGAPGAGVAGKAYVIFSSVLGPVFVDFNFTGTELGTQPNPFNTIAEALEAVPERGTIVIAPGSTTASVTVAKPVTMVNRNPGAGVVRIGAS